MTLNMETVIIAGTIIDVVCLLVLARLWYLNRLRYSGLFFWVADFALLTCGNLLVALRGSIPDWASMFLGNALIIYGIILLLSGLARFFGIRISRSPVYLIMALFLVYLGIQFYFSIPENDLLIRKYNTAAGFILFCLTGVWLLSRLKDPGHRNISRFTASSLGLIVILNIVRVIGLAYGNDPTNDYLDSGTFDSFIMVLLSGATALLTFSLVLMVNRRLYLEAVEMERAVKRSEKQLQAVFKATAVGFARVTNRVINDVNEALCRITGYSREEMIGQSTRIWYFNDEEYEKGWALYDQTAAQGIAGSEIRLRRKDGEIIYVIKNISALDKNNLSAGVVISLIDITERKKDEDALREELDIRANFINILAHELKNPLTPIITSTEILKDLLAKNPDPVLQRLSANAYRGILTLSSRLEDLLNLARYSRGAFTINSQPADVVKFIDEVTTRYRPSLEHSGRKLVIHLSEPLPVTNMDSSRMEQVLVNLLSNAEKYSPAGTDIKLTARADNGNLLIAVTDRGKGLSVEDQKTLFQPYHRLKQDRLRSPGLGLGLFICKQIVEAHGGTIQVTSRLNEGSTFAVSLPVQGKASS